MNDDVMANGKTLDQAILDQARDSKVSMVTMRQIEDLLIPKPKSFTNKQIKALRKRINISQGVMAHYLNVNYKTYQKWESGEVTPKGAALRLLNLVKEKGMAALF